jgi:hypothetical protein
MNSCNFDDIFLEEINVFLSFNFVTTGSTFYEYFFIVFIILVYSRNIDLIDCIYQNWYQVVERPLSNFKLYHTVGNEERKNEQLTVIVLFNFFNLRNQTCLKKDFLLVKVQSVFIFVEAKVVLAMFVLHSYL